MEVRVPLVRRFGPCRLDDLEYSGFATVFARGNMVGKLVFQHGVVDHLCVSPRVKIGGKLVFSRRIVDRRCVSMYVHNQLVLGSTCTGRDGRNCMLLLCTGIKRAEFTTELNVVEDTLSPASVVCFLVCAFAYISVHFMLMSLRLLFELPFRVCCWVVPRSFINNAWRERRSPTDLKRAGGNAPLFSCS